jgi:hypothetical protein
MKEGRPMIPQSMTMAPERMRVLSSLVEEPKEQQDCSRGVPEKRLKTGSQDRMTVAKARPVSPMMRGLDTALALNFVAEER